MYRIRMKDVIVPVDYNEKNLIRIAARRLGLMTEEILDCKIWKKSIDARKKLDIKCVLTLDLELKEEIEIIDKNTVPIQDISYSIPKCSNLEKRPVVVGFGPCGMFAALILAQAGQCPIVIERGSSIEKRQVDTQMFWKNRKLDTESNVQFGEGGAGTFSDGKLNTGVKDFRIRKILDEFVKAGAPEEILWEAKPHVGTDKLPLVVRTIREEIKKLGGQIKFDTKMTEIIFENQHVKGIKASHKGEVEEYYTDNLILAIGHSARDTFRYLEAIGVPMAAKAFSVGARIEHKAAMIDLAQYGRADSGLPAADYKIAAHLANGIGVYTFCMCPGGYVVGAASQDGGVVTNGMSAFARDGENSNSALLVGVTPENFGNRPLDGIRLQENLEQAAYRLGGGNYNAPVQRVEDFLLGKITTKFGDVKPTYEPGTAFVDLNKLFPAYISKSMREGIKLLSRKLRGFDYKDAILTAPETRSSSPVRILRNEDLSSPFISGLYPCGEGAGWAGGIVSAAVDGIRAAEMVLEGCNANVYNKMINK